MMEEATGKMADCVTILHYTAFIQGLRGRVERRKGTLEECCDGNTVKLFET